MPEITVTDEQGVQHIFPDGSTPEMIAKALNVKPPTLQKNQSPDIGVAMGAEPGELATGFSLQDIKNGSFGMGATTFGLRQAALGGLDVAKGMGSQLAENLTDPVMSLYHAGKSVYDLGKQAIEVPGAIKDLYQSDNALGALALAAPRAGGQAAATVVAQEAGARIPGATAKVVQKLPAEYAAKVVPESALSTRQLGEIAAKDVETKGSNLSAALQTGGNPKGNVLVHEDIGRPILDDIREAAVKEGVTADDFKGRQGYDKGQQLTKSVRKKFDDAYDSLVEPVAGNNAVGAAKTAAKQFLGEMLPDAKLMDKITGGNSAAKVQALADEIADQKTIGDLDNFRKDGLNRADKYVSKGPAAQYQSPVMQEAIHRAGNAVRKAVYSEMEQAYGGQIPEEVLRDLQKRHGAAIQADNMMSETRQALSKIASEESSPAGPWQRFKGVGYRGTMGSKAHAAAGLVEKLLPPSEIELFNTRMQRVLKDISPETSGYQPPVPSSVGGEYLSPETQNPRSPSQMNLSETAPGTYVGISKPRQLPESTTPVGKTQLMKLNVQDVLKQSMERVIAEKEAIRARVGGDMAPSGQPPRGGGEALIPPSMFGGDMGQQAAMKMGRVPPEGKLRAEVPAGTIPKLPPNMPNRPALPAEMFNQKLTTLEKIKAAEMARREAIKAMEYRSKINRNPKTGRMERIQEGK